MKRFTETNKWDDPWFRSLAGAHKLIFLYIVDRCNNAGFWELDEEAVVYHTKLDKRYLESAWKALEKGMVVSGGWVWVRTFLKHQKNDVLNPVNPAHRQIITMLKEQQSRFKKVSEFLPKEGPYKGLTSPISIGIGKGIGDEGGLEETTKARCSQSEAEAFCQEIGLTQSDGDWFYHKCVGQGWKNGGEPIASWKGTIQAWKRIGIMASQKHGATARPKAESSL